MKLQLALDLVDIAGARRLLEELHGLVEIAEIGTPFIIRAGVGAVTTLAGEFPSSAMLADLKIVDAGQHEAELAFAAGADIVTVLGVAHDATIAGAVLAARQHGKQVMADLIAVADVAARALQLEALGVDYVCVHAASDLQQTGGDPLAQLSAVRSVLQRSQLAVAGGVKPETMPALVRHRPDVVVVGGYICNHDDPRQAALKIREHFPRDAS